MEDYLCHLLTFYVLEEICSHSSFSAVLPISITAGKDLGKADRYVLENSGSFLANLVNLAILFLSSSCL